MPRSPTMSTSASAPAASSSARRRSRRAELGERRRARSRDDVEDVELEARLPPASRAIGEPMAPSPMNPRRFIATPPLSSSRRLRASTRRLPAPPQRLRRPEPLRSSAAALSHRAVLERAEVGRLQLGVDVELGDPQRAPRGARRRRGARRPRAARAAGPRPAAARASASRGPGCPRSGRGRCRLRPPGSPTPLARTKARGLGGIGQRAAQRLRRQVLVAFDPAELGLDRDAAGPQLVRATVREGQVLLVGEPRAVGHHGVDAAAAAARSISALVAGVVELHEDRHRAPRPRPANAATQALAALRGERRRARPGRSPAPRAPPPPAPRPRSRGGRNT